MIQIRVDDHYDDWQLPIEKPKKPTKQDLCEHEWEEELTSGEGYYIATCKKCNKKIII